MIPRSAPRWAWFAAGALVLVFFLQVLLVSRLKSPAWDEPGHLAAGVAYLQAGNFLVNPQHPPLLKELSALSLMLTGARLPEGPPTRELLKGNPDYQWMVGSKILVTGDFERNLLRARLPLMLVATAINRHSGSAGRAVPVRAESHGDRACGFCDDGCGM